MALPKDYSNQRCSLARSLEVVGERWTLLIVRDAFFGVRRFGDFAAHLSIPRAVLTERLVLLVDEQVLMGTDGSHGHTEYVLTDKGLGLWQIVRGLLAWGDEYYSTSGPRRTFHHSIDGGTVGEDGACDTCGQEVAIQELVIAPGPGLPKKPEGTDLVSVALTSPHRLLDPIRV